MSNAPVICNQAPPPLTPGGGRGIAMEMGMVMTKLQSLATAVQGKLPGVCII